VHDLVLPGTMYQPAHCDVLAMNKIAVIGWESCPVEWWVDIADQLTASGESWCESACLMDLRFWEGQVRLGRRKRVPSRRQLMKRWHWGDWQVRKLLKSESWMDNHHTQNLPNISPNLSQNAPSFQVKTQEQTGSVSQNAPKQLPNSSQIAPHGRNTQTQTQPKNTKQACEPAGLS
jgi:hypothetical protein